MQVTFIVISCGECRGQAVGARARGKDAGGIRPAACFAGFNQMQLFVDEKELSVTEVKTTTLRC